MSNTEFEKIWINASEKLVSFQEIIGWNKYTFPSKEKAVCCLDQLIIMGYRFQ